MSKELHPVFTAGLTIILKDNRVLLIKRSKNCHYEPGSYTLPSGTKEDNETALQAAVRETMEEVGVKVDPLQTKFAQVMIRRHPNGEEWADFFFATQKWEGTPMVMEPDKCDGFDWFDLNELPEGTIPFIKAAINNFTNNIIYSEFGFTS